MKFTAAQGGPHHRWNQNNIRHDVTVQTPTVLSSSSKSLKEINKLNQKKQLSTSSSTQNLRRCKDYKDYQSQMFLDFINNIQLRYRYNLDQQQDSESDSLSLRTNTNRFDANRNRGYQSLQEIQRWQLHSMISKSQVKDRVITRIIRKRKSNNSQQIYSDPDAKHYPLQINKLNDKNDKTADATILDQTTFNHYIDTIESVNRDIDTIFVKQGQAYSEDLTQASQILDKSPTSRYRCDSPPRQLQYYHTNSPLQQNLQSSTTTSFRIDSNSPTSSKYGFSKLNFNHLGLNSDQIYSPRQEIIPITRQFREKVVLAPNMSSRCSLSTGFKNVVKRIFGQQQYYSNISSSSLPESPFQVSPRPDQIKQTQEIIIENEQQPQYSFVTSESVYGKPEDVIIKNIQTMITEKLLLIHESNQNQNLNQNEQNFPSQQTDSSSWTQSKLFDLLRPFMTKESSSGPEKVIALDLSKQLSDTMFQFKFHSSTEKADSEYQQLLLHISSMQISFYDPSLIPEKSYHGSNHVFPYKSIIVKSIQELDFLSSQTVSMVTLQNQQSKQSNVNAYEIRHVLSLNEIDFRKLVEIVVETGAPSTSNYGQKDEKQQLNNKLKTKVYQIKHGKVVPQQLIKQHRNNHYQTQSQQSKLPQHGTGRIKRSTKWNSRNNLYDNCDNLYHEYDDIQYDPQYDDPLPSPLLQYSRQYQNQFQNQKLTSPRQYQNQNQQKSVQWTINPDEIYMIQSKGLISSNSDSTGDLNDIDFQINSYNMNQSNYTRTSDPMTMTMDSESDLNSELNNTNSLLSKHLEFTQTYPTSRQTSQSTDASVESNLSDNSLGNTLVTCNTFTPSFCNGFTSDDSPEQEVWQYDEQNNYGSRKFDTEASIADAESEVIAIKGLELDLNHDDVKAKDDTNSKMNLSNCPSSTNLISDCDHSHNTNDSHNTSFTGPKLLFSQSPIATVLVRFYQSNQKGELDLVQLKIEFKDVFERTGLSSV